MLNPQALSKASCSQVFGDFAGFLTLVAGTTTNNAFFSAGLVDEIFADVHPLLLGGGMSAITLPQFEEKLELIDQKAIGDGVVQIHYRVVTA